MTFNKCLRIMRFLSMMSAATVVIGLVLICLSNLPYSDFYEMQTNPHHVPLTEHILQQRGPPPNSVSCRALFNGSATELTRAREYMSKNTPIFLQNQDYIALTEDCTKFRKLRGYITKPLSAEEAKFPIGFSILMYNDVEQVERLLRAIYMPQNYYCIHVDARAPRSVVLATRSITSCFSNVFIPPKLEKVYWGHISILKAESNCVKELLKYSWKYYINISGQMFPLQTNRNLVKILKMFNGANDIEGTILRVGKNKVRNTLRHKVKWAFLELFGNLHVFPSPIPKLTPVPNNLTIYKGSNQVAASRAFIEYAYLSQEGADLMNWLSDTFAPDEHFLPTLNHNKNSRAPGGYTGDPEKKVFTARASIWKKGNAQMDWSWDHQECQGKWVRAICVLGIGDLPWAYNRPELFVNKLHMDFEPLTLDCMEELMYNRTIAQYPFDPTYYENLDIVKHRENVNLV